MVLTQRELIEAQQRILRGEEPQPITQVVSTLSAKEKQQLMAQKKAETIEQARVEGLIPREAEVTRVIPTREGYQIAYVIPPPKVPTWKETTATGQIMERGYVWKTGARLHMGPKIYEMTPEQQRKVLAKTVGIREVGAGFVSVAEQWGGLIGKPTPPGPVSGAIGVAIGRPKAWEEYMETPTLYKVGQVPAMVFESALTGVVAGKLVSVGKMGVGWVAKTRYVKPIAAPIARTVKFGRVAKAVYKGKLAVKAVTPTFRGSRAEMFLIKRVPRYAKYATKRISRGEIALSPLKQPLTFKQLQASQVAWQLTRIPRTGGVILIQKGIAPTKTKVLPHLISRAGKVSIGYLRQLGYYEEPIWKRGLLPFVTQKQVTRLGIVPYIPRAVVSTGKKAVSTFGIGLGVAIVAKAITIPKIVVKAVTVPRLVVPQAPKIKRRQRLIVTPKPWRPTLTLEREKFRPLTLPTPKVKQRERLVPALKIPTIQYQETPPIQITPQAVTHKQATQQIPAIPTPTMPKIPSIPAYPLIRLGGGRRGRGADRRWFVKWWRKQQRIKTPRQMLKTYFDDKAMKKVREVF